jgi:hypothetical protein
MSLTNFGQLELHLVLPLLVSNHPLLGTSCRSCWLAWKHHLLDPGNIKPLAVMHNEANTLKDRACHYCVILCVQWKWNLAYPSCILTQTQGHKALASFQEKHSVKSWRSLQQDSSLSNKTGEMLDFIIWLERNQVVLYLFQCKLEGQFNLSMHVSGHGSGNIIPCGCCQPHLVEWVLQLYPTI